MRNACMGGWCVLRERCSLYQPGMVSLVTFERLCTPGQSDCYLPKQITPTGVQILLTEETP